MASLFWSRGLATATVEPRTRRTAALTPLTRGDDRPAPGSLAVNTCAVLDVRGGRLALDEAWEWNVQGTTAPRLLDRTA